MLVISNPAAGDRSGPAFIDQHVLPRLRNAGRAFTHVTSDSPGHAGALAAHYASTANPPLVIVTGGGDGTVHEVVNAIYSSNQPGLLPVSLIILPLGTANALYASFFPPSATGHIENKLASLDAFLSQPIPTAVPLAIQSTTVRRSIPSTEPIFSVVVTSTALHAAILETADKLREREDLKGTERFKVAAQQNISTWYHATLTLFPTPAGSVGLYNPITKRLENTSTSPVEIQGPFTYFLSTVNVDRLEPHFQISPLHSRLPQHGLYMDIIVVRPHRHPKLQAAQDTSQSRDAFVPTTMAVLTQAYQAGAHVDLRYHEDGSCSLNGSGVSVVQVYRCGGWDWAPADEAGRKVCTDGTIVHIDSGDTVECRLLSNDKFGSISVYATTPSL